MHNDMSYFSRCNKRNPRVSLHRFIAFWFASIVIAGPCLAQDELLQHPVYQAFAAYKAAILEANAEKTLALVDSNTIQYYGAMLDHALNSDETTVRALDMMDLLMVMSIRHRVDPEHAKAMNATSLLEHGVNSGWIGKESVMGMDVTHIDVEGDQAAATFTASNVQAPVPFQFNREGGTWKIDLTSIMEVSGSAFKQLAEQQEVTEVDLIFMLLGMISSKEVDQSSIWVPINSL